jgi:hypothetical protein
MSATKAIQVFTVICAWCDEILSNKPLLEASKHIAEDLPQTHTICKSCLEKMRQEINEIRAQGVQKKIVRQHNMLSRYQGM